MDSRDWTIGVLSTTAVMLLVGLLIINSRPPIARADGMTTTGGDYTITVGALTQQDEDLVYVTANSMQKLNVYRFDTTRHRIELLEQLDLTKMREAAATPRRGR